MEKKKSGRVSYLQAPSDPKKLQHIEYDLNLLGYKPELDGEHISITHDGKPFDFKSIEKISAKHGLHPVELEHGIEKSETVSMPKKDFIEEHKNLVNILNEGDPKKLKAEAKDQAKELKEEVCKCELEDCVCKNLAKSFLQVDGGTKTDTTAHNAAAGELPPEVWNWGVMHLVPMKKDDIGTFPFSWMHETEAKSVLVKIRKHNEDLYSGWIEKGTEKIHEFDHLTMPELLSQLRSKVEFYQVKPTVPPLADNFATGDEAV